MSSFIDVFILCILSSVLVPNMKKTFTTEDTDEDTEKPLFLDNPVLIKTSLFADRVRRAGRRLKN